LLITIYITNFADNYIYFILKVNTYLAFSIVATIFAGVLLICYSIGIALIQNGKPCSENSQTQLKHGSSLYPGPGYQTHTAVSLAKECRTSVGLGAMIIIFAVAEFGVGIWSSICCCMVYSGGCCDTSTPQTVNIHVVLVSKVLPCIFVIVSHFTSHPRQWYI
jgi:hypothetical protein